MVSPGESYWARCRRFAGYPATASEHRAPSMQEHMTSCYAFTRYEQECITDSLHEFVLSKYFNARGLKDVLDEIEAEWLITLFVIIKASLLKMVFHETYVCTRGDNTRFQRDFARAQVQDAALKNEMIRNCIRSLFELVAGLPSQSGLQQKFSDEFENTSIYLHRNHNGIYSQILSYYRNVFHCETE